ncbi:MAG: short-chain dehydrogenase [Hyphomicrobium sp. 32-62-53]|nr:MAG: short-chain dehydrogenase [Hyphomicrobium sp. 12-62-95]OYX98130.1 MAG: short-chain dehydrogenase [Hyphomicrobium sp. 32-62-53]
MATSAEQIRSYEGPAILSYGFRPFFFFGCLWALAAMALWLSMLQGRVALPITLSPVQWHVHELIFGYVPAVVAGFLLTAVPNWTGRLPVVGRPLLLLFVAWVAGRIALITSELIGAPLAAAIDLIFLSALGAVIAREIIAGNNTRNLKVLAVVALLWIANALFHAEAITGSTDGYGTRLGVAATVFLIQLIGGRIIPSFTRNWLARREAGRLPVVFDRFDALILVVSALTLCSWVLMPTNPGTAVMAFAAAVLNLVRLFRWAGYRTWAEPLVLILHIAYAFVPLGFLLLGLGILQPGMVSPTGALHGWTAGAIGIMTLAVMTRATRGHTGQELTAAVPTQVIYALAITSALARIVAAFGILRDPMLTVSATAWCLAFAGFLVVYGPLLVRSRQ